ncbi:MAG TPA: CHAT domain-containing tetratricopeptide repeat protein [Xanthobacteraceae bacterium]|jgi:CHAT domain-containing protein/Tfp pilus assembly protein PilF|nr:CHAT domain-containing tetratricopeptide repeat protein [Xanthobacteraceae bacterium]
MALAMQTSRILFALMVAVAIAIHSASAQVDSIVTSEQQYNEYRNAGNYPAALSEARRLQKEIAFRSGINSPNYASALNKVAMALEGLRKYDEAESAYRSALKIFQQTVGASHPAVATVLVNLGSLYDTQGNYREAAVAYARALAIVETTNSTGYATLPDVLYGLANVEDKLGDYGEAEGNFNRLLEIRKQTVGPNHPLTADTLNDLGVVYLNQGRLGEATQSLSNALDIRRKVFGENDVRVAQTLTNLGNVYVSQGRYAQAEDVLQRALAIKERAFGTDSAAVAGTINDLANIYDVRHKYREAEGLYRRAVAIEEQALGINHPDLAAIIGGLANVLANEGEYTEAEGLYKRALSINQRALGNAHPAVAAILTNLGNLSQTQGKNDQAEVYYSQAITIYRPALGPAHGDLTYALESLANLYIGQGKYADAERLLKDALSTERMVLGLNHPRVANTLKDLAILYQLTGDIGMSLANARKATAALVGYSAKDVSLTNDVNTQNAIFYIGHVGILARAARGGVEPESSLSREGFVIAQLALQSSAGAALQEMASRFASGDNALAAIVRNQQDLTAFWHERNKALIEALSKPQSQLNQVLIDSIRRQIADTETKLNDVAAQLERDFPSYATLENPMPLQVEETQSLLSVDEALVFLLTGYKESYVFAVTRDGFGWKVIPVGNETLPRKVAAFRHGLDINEVEKSIRESKTSDLFDLGLANELYTAFLEPLEPLIKDKKQLIIVPSGPLTALPFHLLVTNKPAQPRPDSLSGYRDAAWLMKHHAVSILPSVTSLKALRMFTGKDEAKKPMVGFGDPLFNPNATQPSGSRLAGNAGVRNLTTRSYTDFFQGVGIDRALLAQALPPLPDTADELRAVAKDLGAPASDIHLGKDASETTLKHLPLSEYRVVYFATHGLVAGDIKGLAEPSLALSAPAQPTQLDDGLLTASEVAQLKLNADWVVLSACNTVAGDRPGAEALSGLARAFFYAGARALLVSHWAVATDAATRLTTSTFDILKANPTLGRAEALRRAELAYLNDTSDPRNAHPAFWGPFEIVGEGTAR